MKLSYPFKATLIVFALPSFTCNQSNYSPNQTDSNSKNASQVIYRDDSCRNIHTTTSYLNFSKDTTTTDFYHLLQLIESKGELSRYNSKYRTESRTNEELVLEKILCLEQDLNPPIERWVLQHFFSIRYILKGHKPLKGTKNIYPAISIIQYNFKTEEEKKKAYIKMKEIRWGDPLMKWNEFYLLTSKTRIIILELNAPIFTQITEEYQDIIQKEWIEKYDF